jgi:chemotaxis protein MotB
MAGRIARRRDQGADYWPGFVDALATLLLVLIFLLSFFIVVQFLLRDALSGRNQQLASLSAELAALGEALALEKSLTSDLQGEIANLRATLALSSENVEALTVERDSLLGRVAGLTEAQDVAGTRIAGLESALAEEEALTDETLDELSKLNAQLAALRAQIATLNAALEAAEVKDLESQAQIVDLGKRLNAALAQKVSELARYRSEFFGRLREALGNRDDVEIVGDRFVIQSGILFDSGSAVINPEGRTELAKLATTLATIADAIPPEIGWVLRVDGHSDRRPISTPEFPSNWHLSAARAISVVRFLEARGIPSGRLVAAGFGANHPLAEGEGDEVFRRNRRIELKLTER